MVFSAARTVSGHVSRSPERGDILILGRKPSGIFRSG
jgi:hypothetical protein